MMSVSKQILFRFAPQMQVAASRSLSMSMTSSSDKVTHTGNIDFWLFDTWNSLFWLVDTKNTHFWLVVTGQTFSESDPRNVRFAVTGLEKQVNDQWAIDLIAKVPPIVVNKRIVSKFNIMKN